MVVFMGPYSHMGQFRRSMGENEQCFPSAASFNTCYCLVHGAIFPPGWHGFQVSTPAVVRTETLPLKTSNAMPGRQARYCYILHVLLSVCWDSLRTFAVTNDFF